MLLGWEVIYIYIYNVCYYIRKSSMRLEGRKLGFRVRVLEIWVWRLGRYVRGYEGYEVGKLRW